MDDLVLVTTDESWRMVIEQSSLSALTKEKLIQVIDDTERTMVTAEEFKAIVSEVDVVQIDRQKFFLVNLKSDGQSKIKLSSEKSLHWDEFSIQSGPFEDIIYRGDFPRWPINACFEIITCRGDRLRAWLDLSQQYMAEGPQWRLMSGSYINRYIVVAWVAIG